ncbi:dicarboxylate/amino acid:cation symporter [Parvibaculum sp.]|uniref:dicarboxylate/amino acid:cation symporter n=1 Tax=Parvibaculum sp. TaxID=2024848 RepID=UPI001B030D41|nr:dicarboxylate/amino acid:cation symporter [Parvibaculum sp.]MBO6634287.1 dicarboxylate/amino acid:cation symporter [Parvibaculum sp.]MBO6680265.1 dicarboxylate/amino acid:cation symporter [Parvibaculum sp.]MBO6685897.1 dicarboxylate/amino acid:cation symporter [Parvibaculum sp.]MBO6905486.1 dicarboxylate/amino acid:cation symporter [Parvibaculum sp.]
MKGGTFSAVEHIFPKSQKFLTGRFNRLVQGRLWLQVLIGMVLGIGTGLLINPDTGFVSKPVANGIGEWLALPGNLFLAFIQMIVVPLILASITRGIAAATDVRQLKSTGVGLAFYFVGSTIVAAALGVVIGLTLTPGNYVDRAVAPAAELAGPVAELAAEGEARAAKPFSLVDLPTGITELLPTNPLNSIVSGDMLQIVIFSIVLGVGLLSVPPQSSKPLFELLGSVQEICMAIVATVMMFAPVAVFGLLAQAMIKTGPGVLTGLAAYAAVVVFGMAVLLVFYLVTALVLGGRNPLEMLRSIREPFLLGFSTNSSAATMPVTVKTAEEVLKVRPSLSQFIVPLGATMNMGGTALYQALATIFMAQLYQIDLSMGMLLVLIATTVGASIGTPAVPGVGIVVLASVLSSVGVPLSGLALIVGLDRILERFRTSLNVTGDLVACVVMDRLVPAKVSRESEIRSAAEREHIQETRNEDVVINSRGGH